MLHMHATLLVPYFGRAAVCADGNDNFEHVHNPCVRSMIGKYDVITLFDSVLFHYNSRVSQCLNGAGLLVMNSGNGFRV
jgi:hypothetical protein